MSDGIERAALLLLGMGEDNATQVVKYLEPDQVKKLGVKISNMTNVSEEDCREVINDFLYEVNRQVKLGNNALTGSYDIPGQDKNEFSLFLQLSSKEMYEHLYGEHPQIIAMILLELKPKISASLLSYFSTKEKAELLIRMSQSNPLSKPVKENLKTIIREKIAKVEQKKERKQTQLEAVTNIITHMKPESERDVFEKIDKLDSNLSTKLKKNVMSFENLILLNQEMLKTLIYQADKQILLSALKGSTKNLQETLLSNVSEQDRNEIIKGVRETGPLTVQTVVEAQNSIVSLAKTLI